jgi:predicted nuclease of predicted toxin-antitoxin system
MEPPDFDYSGINVWIDAHLSTIIAKWLVEDFGINASSLKYLGLRDADDEIIFFAARDRKAIIITKDIDLKILQDKFGQPPKIIRLTIGNTSNSIVRKILTDNFDFIVDYLVIQDKPYLEIAD